MGRLKSACAWALLVALSLVRSAQGADLFDFQAPAPARVIQADYFGTHFHRLWAPDAPGRQPTIWPENAIGTIRLWDSLTRWGDLEPRPGQFNFDRLDFAVASAERHQASVLLVLGSPAPWASARPQEPGPYGPGSAAEPMNLADWDRYVTTVARRYKGRIKSYELWNEPFYAEVPGQEKYLGRLYFTGSVHKMVELARRARAVLDREDPAAVLLTPGVSDGAQVLDLFLAAGGGRYVGGVTYHYYVKSDLEFLALHRQIQAVLVRHALGALPLINSEAGFESKGDKAVSGALLMARQMILGAFVGLDRYYQYAWDNGIMGMSGTAGGPPESRSGEAYAAVRRWLLGTRPERCHREPDGVAICEGARAGARLLLAWRPEGGGVTMRHLPAGMRIGAIERAVANAQLSQLDRGDLIAVSDNPVAVWFQP
jgi:hypothetical protein